MLESTLLSEIISEVSIRVKVISSDTPLTFRELSEGEQQLLTVLGLLKFTGGKDSLFLLDEPDTHLNPSWAVKYLKFLRDFVPNHETSHLLMVTHHPLAIAELEKQQVQVMWRDPQHQVYAQEPEESPRGMGINLILRSDMFGLKTTLDDITQEKLTARNKLASKDKLSQERVQRDPEKPSESDEEYLTRLNGELAELGFNLSADDPDYMDYLREKYHGK
jgi:translation initiation factor RLI1